jgi:hypothetical protein
MNLIINHIYTNLEVIQSVAFGSFFNISPSALGTLKPCESADLQGFFFSQGVLKVY